MSSTWEARKEAKENPRAKGPKGENRKEHVQVLEKRKKKIFSEWVVCWT